MDEKHTMFTKRNSDAYINMCLGCKHHCYFTKWKKFSEITTYLHTKCPDKRY